MILLAQRLMKQATKEYWVLCKYRNTDNTDRMDTTDFFVL